MPDLHIKPTNLHLVALVTGLGPILSVHIAYLVSASQGYVPWCFPYTDSCTSISATGRHGIGFFLFKGTMIPSAMLLMLFWYVCTKWLEQLGEGDGFRRAILGIGVVAAAFLIVYTVALGASGDALRLQRRIGVIIYFSFTFLSQILLTYRLGKLTARLARVVLPLQILNYAVLGIGIATLVLAQVMATYGDYEDAFEWVLALLIHVYFLAIWMIWRRSSFTVTFSVMK